MGRILVIAPHCDDEILGCFTQLRRYASRCEVIIGVSHGGESEDQPHVQGDALANWRESETLAAMKYLGVPSVRFLRLGYPFELGDNESQRFQYELKRLFAVTVYDKVFAPHPQDKHADHALLGRIVREEVLGRCPIYWYFGSQERAKQLLRSQVITQPTDVVRYEGAEYQEKEKVIRMFDSQRHFLLSYFRHSEWFEKGEFFWVEQA